MNNSVLNVCHVKGEKSHVDIPKTVYVCQYLGGCVSQMFLKVIGGRFKRTQGNLT